VLKLLAFILGLFTFAVATVLLIGVIFDVAERWRKGEF
jgi:hypothetical protein